MVGLVVLTALAFAPARLHEFILYDDTVYVTENPRVQQGVTPANLWWALTTLDAGYWHPLTWWSHMLDCELFGLAAGGHHVTSVVLHAVAAVLLFAALDAMTGALYASGFVAALFALHPLHVESVAYIAERKDVLSGVFWMLTLLAYARYVRAPSRGRYAAVVGAFVLGLMAKPMVVTLPFVLLLLDYWPLRRVSIPVRDGALLRRVVAEKIPMLVLAVVASVTTTGAASGIGAVADLETMPLGRRLANAVIAYVTYLSKTVWPANLACFYPYPASFDPVVVALAATALVVVSVAAVLLARRLPYVAVGWFWYLGTLVPVIGLVQVGQHAMADRYTYLPLVGPFIAITWAARAGLAGTRRGRSVLAGAAALVLGACVVTTRAELAHWRDSVALFEHAIAVTERNHVAHNNLGIAYRNAGRPDEARAQFEAALAIVPDYLDARNNYGLALRDANRDAEALATFREVLRRVPGYAEAQLNLGETLVKLRDWPAAAAELQTAVDLRPDHAPSHVRLGAALRALGKLDEAVVHERRALELSPDSPEAECFLADALAELGRTDEALQHYRRAIALQPEYADAHYNLGTTLARSGQIDAALGHFEAAVRLAPDHVEAHNNLGRAFAAKGRHDEAIAEYSEAIRLMPDFAIGLANRANAYEQVGKLDLAAADRARAAELGLRQQ